MEGDAVSATIGVLEGAEKLRDTFGMIQNFLEDAQTKSITEAAVKTWLKKLEAKTFDADNALDELNYQLLSNKRKKWVASCFQSEILLKESTKSIRVSSPLIRERAFEGASTTPDLEYIAKIIAERRKGLPLAANVVVGVLSDGSTYPMG
ncbi:hypothetical protein ACS0TY_026415 [Phlomoides rotata]